MRIGGLRGRRPLSRQGGRASGNHDPPRTGTGPANRRLGVEYPPPLSDWLALPGPEPAQASGHDRPRVTDPGDAECRAGLGSLPSCHVGMSRTTGVRPRLGGLTVSRGARLIRMMIR